MQISVQLYSVREAFAADPEATLRRLSGIGFTHVEPFAVADHAEILRPLLAEHGLTPSSAHTSLLGADDPARVIATASALGVSTVIEPMWDPKHWEHVADIEATAERLNDLAPIAAEHGVRIGYHNHDFEARPVFDGRCGLEVLDDHLDPRVVLELDTFWAAVGGTDPVQLLRSLGGRVRLVHLKDGPLTGNVRDQQPLGRGAMDVPAILAAADRIETGVIEFDDHDGDIFAAIEASHAQLQTYLQEDRA